MQLDCEDDDAMIHPSTPCGEHAEAPCCHLQEVLSHLQEGDSVYLSQRSTEKHLQCNHIKQVQVKVRKSFTLRTGQSKLRGDQGSSHGIQGISMELTNNCSESCSVTIDQSRFSCSSLTFNNLNIWIKDSIVTNGFITARSLPQVDSNSYHIKIQGTEFHSSQQLKDKNDSGLIQTGPSQQLNFISVSGYWDVVDVQGSVLEGERQGSLSGIEIVHAYIRALNLVDAHVSFLFSALDVSSSSAVDTFYVTESIFLGNRDGIDMGQGVRHMMISRSQMNDTGSWFGNGDVPEQCSSALKGSAQSVIVEDSVFAHNHASGTNCNGVALHLRSKAHGIPLLMSNNDTFENGNLGIPAVKVTVMKSVFYDNKVKNCPAGLDFENGGSGGAVTVYGLQLMIKIMASTFVRNEACKGAGLYIGMQDKFLVDYSQNRTTGQGLSSTIIIDTCTFKENTAQSGGGLMTEFTQSMLDNGTSLITLIYNCLFSSNNASYHGAGIHLLYSNVFLNPGVEVFVRVSDTVFKENTAGDGDRVRDTDSGGGGMYVSLTSLTLMSNASVGIVVNNCTFISNRAWYGAGIGTDVYLCSLYSNSSLTLQTSHSIFTSNTAMYGAAMDTDMSSCYFHPYSSVIFEAYHCSFMSNTAEHHGGCISTSMGSCSLRPHSSFTL